MFLQHLNPYFYKNLTTLTFIARVPWISFQFNILDFSEWPSVTLISYFPRGGFNFHLYNELISYLNFESYSVAKLFNLRR
jgi:hypothetical protein